MKGEEEGLELRELWLEGTREGWIEGRNRIVIYGSARGSGDDSGGCTTVKRDMK